VVGQHRSTQRKAARPRSDEKRLTADIVRLASDFGRYSYRRITALLQRKGWRVNAKRVERIWRREGLKVPQKQPKRGRLWLNDGSCVRLRPQYRGHVWSYDFVADRTHDGKAFRMLTVIDEHSRSAWRSMSSASSRATTCWPFWLTCSPGTDHRRISDRRMAKTRLQQQAAGRAAQRRDLLYHAQSGDPDRSLARPQQ
jgi:hypothetical protein